MNIIIANYLHKIMLHRSSALLTLGCLFLAAGCQQTASRAGQEQLNLARQQYDGGRYNLTIQSTTTFLQREGSSLQAGEALYLRGLAHLQLGGQESGPGRQERNRNAREDFLAAIKQSKDPYIRSLAYVALGHIGFEADPARPQETIDHYRAALELLSEPTVRDVVLYRLGVSLQRSGQWSQADDNFSTLMADYPASEFAARARENFGATCWRLQWGAYSKLSGAQNLISQLKQKNITADWQAVTIDKKLLHKVRSGRYQTYDEAQKAAIPARLINSEVIFTPAP